LDVQSFFSLTRRIFPVAGATAPSFQAAYESFTVATPNPASLTARTGPWNKTPQHRSLSSSRTVIGLAEASLPGSSISVTGWTSAGTLVWLIEANVPSPSPGVPTRT